MFKTQDSTASAGLSKTGPCQRLLDANIQTLIEEFETLETTAIMASSASEDGIALEIAKTMISAYISGNFPYSARLRAITTGGGQAWLYQKCAKLVAQRIRLEESQVKDIIDAPQAHETLYRRQSTEYSTDTSTSTDITSSPSSSSPSPSPANHSSGSSPSSNKHSGLNTSDEEITNVRPLNQKPSFRFLPSSLAYTLPDFLASMKAANEKLATEESGQHKIELSESDSEQPHIEMNLGLGVLEQIKSEDEPHILPQDNIKSKGSISELSIPRKKKLKLSTGEENSKHPALDRNQTSESSSSPTSPVKIKLTHHKKDDETETGKGKAVNNTKNSKKAQKAEPGKRIKFKLFIKCLATSKPEEVKVEADYDWSSVVGYHPDQETEKFPEYVEPGPEELQEFSDSIMRVVGLNQLPGYRVIEE